ncbi:MAG TPA: hypothetical protein PLO62_02555 [Candidatus Hydrogenedentes bacterium]|nr:hypothetical protein [Candidatus Hydrogenedentota bacterium]HOS02076.1 hypothetical protein [Candidatus Hydrogenedentota bacterium]
MFIATSEGRIMLGIQDKWVFLAYVLMVGSALLCVIYGALTWNKGDEPIKPEDIHWAKEEKEEIEEAL